MRQLSTAAKILNELEGLLKEPYLIDIVIVKEKAPFISRIGRKLREVAQAKLLAALKDQVSLFI